MMLRRRLRFVIIKAGEVWVLIDRKAHHDSPDFSVRHMSFDDAVFTMNLRMKEGQ